MKRCRWQFRLALALFAATYAAVLLKLQTGLEKHPYPKNDGVLASSSSSLQRQQRLPGNRRPVTRRTDQTREEARQEQFLQRQRLQPVPVSSNMYATPSSSYVIDPSDLWEQTTPFSSSRSLVMPTWMKNYFRWHKETRRRLQTEIRRDEESLEYRQFRFLVITCLPYYRKCGGFADRLMSIPFLVKVAAMSKRLLLIKWGRPCQLEDFLVPPVGGLDWRVPQWLWDKIEGEGEFSSVQDTLLDFAVQNDTSLSVLRVKFQSHDHGSVYYNDNPVGGDEAGDPRFEEVLGDCWRTLFTPVPALAKLIQEYLDENGLVPGGYVSAHFRALYAVEKRDPSLVAYVAKNAINCTSTVMDHDGYSRVFFSADSSYAAKVAAEHGSNCGILVVAPQRDKDPLHLDKAKNWQELKPADFYDTVVDLYVLSLGRCVTYGMGGYGKLAGYLSYNSACAFQHHASAHMRACNFVKRRTSGNQRPSRASVHGTLFPMPMPLEKEDWIQKSKDAEAKPRALRILTSVEAKPGPASLQLLSEPRENAKEPRMPPSRPLYPDPLAPPSLTLWEQSTRLPKWMKEYFNWHRQQLELLTPDNWNDFRYIIMVCSKLDPQCGGTADRLRPLPFIVRVAAETRRILWMKWEKPAPLESFLLPPVGGIDWRLPVWFGDKISKDNSIRAVSVEKLIRYANNPNNTIIKSRVQASDHGSAYYNTQAQKDGDQWDALRQQYRDCWFTFFTPVPSIARIVESEMLRMQLLPGEFSFAHLRAQYGIEQSGRDPATIKKWTINSLNCVSHLRPGGPFFFSSDSSYARQVAVDYGATKNVSIVTRTETNDPLHLEFVTEGSDPTDYYPVFIDLYLMSFGDCMSYNMGGFGKWGLLLSGRNFTCNIRHWTAGVPKSTAVKSGCQWMSPSVHQAQRNPVELQLPLFLPPMEAVNTRRPL